MLLFVALCLSAAAAELKVHVLDVGQGDSILIEAPGDKHVLVDAGTSGSNVDKMLRARGIEKLDLVVATHPHADHIGGMAKVLKAIPVGMYVDNGMTHTTMTYARTMAAVEAHEVPYRAGLAGRVFNVGSRVRITVVHPRTNKLRGTRSDLNSNSVVLRIDHKKDCFLLTGDAEDPSERAMMKNEIAECDVLKVAHHGSKHSTSMEWLNTIQPRIAVISAGQGNRYKHPSQDTLNRLERIKAQVHRTDLEGTVTLVSTGRSITVQTERVAPERALGTESELLAATSQSTREPTADTTKKKKKKRGFFQWLFGKKDN